MSNVSVSMKASLLALAVLALASSMASALVNPNFTIVDLKAASSEIMVLRITTPRNQKVSAPVTETLLGPKTDGTNSRQIELSFADSGLSNDAIAALGKDGSSDIGMMFVRKDKNRDGEIVGSLEVGTHWMGLVRTAENQWQVVKDPDDLETVWAGSARQLRRAVEYVLADRTAEFPVESGLSWRSSEQIGALKGGAHGTLVTADGVIVLCEAGDRIYQRSTEGDRMVDATKKLKLTSRSRAMTVGDFNGDGHVDLASWDGKRLKLVLRKADNTYAAPTEGSAVAECHSLTTIKNGLVIAAGTHIAIARPNGEGGFAIHRLPGAKGQEKLGDGGAAAVADFDDDGRPDILHLYEKGLLLYPGADSEQRFGSPQLHELDLVKGAVATVCGDYDADGQLDVLVAGKGGVTMLTRTPDGKWKSVMHETGELAVAVGTGRTQTSAINACAADLRGDGRQSVAVFSADAAPGLFYARGFRCFAIAISLTREDDSDGYDALSGGQQAGMVTYLDDDLAPDLLGVDSKGRVWAVLTEPDRLRRYALTVSTPPASDPMTVKVSLGDRLLGIHVLRPGQPTTLVLPRAGNVLLSWRTADGKNQQQSTVVTRHVKIDALAPSKSQGE